MSDVLVVDDEPEIRTITNRFLTKAGHCVVEARDAEQALDLLRQIRFDVVITDVHMPGANGFWLADTVHTIAPATALILSTGDEKLATSENLGRSVVACLIKPFNRSDVLRAVETGVLWAVAERAAQ